MKAKYKISPTQALVNTKVLGQWDFLLRSDLMTFFTDNVDFHPRKYVIF